MSHLRQIASVWSLLILMQVARDQEDLAVTDVNFRKVAERFVAAINRRDLAEIRRVYAASVLKIETLENTEAMVRDILRERGEITKVGEPRVTGHHASLRLTAKRGDWSLKFFLTRDGLIDGYTFDEPKEQIPIPSKNSTKLRLPFRGEWFVNAGGPTREENYHFESGPSSFFGIDFGIRKEDGSAFRGSGQSTEDFYGYGQDILAAGDGEVVIVIEGVPDNPPGEPSLLSSSGNTVVVKHAPQEFSLYAHLKLQSTRVKVGDHVVQGQVIAQCGNSGFTTSPHLHFQLINTTRYSEATGFPPHFRDIFVTHGDKKISHSEYSPRQSDRVSNKP